MARALLCSLVAWLTLGAALAQAAASPVMGRPFLQRYGHAEHGASAQALAVAIGPDGQLWTGNTRGVLRFDGQAWSLIRLPGGIPARAVAVGPDSQVYVGAYDRVGRLVRDATGDYRFEDLTAQLGRGPAQTPLGAVWEIAASMDGVYFRADRELILLGSNGSVRRWPVDEAVRSISIIDDLIYFRVDGQGFMRFRDGAFSLYPGGDVFANQALAKVLKDGDGLLLVGDQGLYRADDKGVAALAMGARLREAWKDFEPYTAARLVDGSLLVASLDARLLHLRANGELISGLTTGEHGVQELSVDREGGVWLATEGDLVRLELPSRWSRFSPAEGLRGLVYDSALFQGELWVATSRGAYRAREQDGQIRFRREAGAAPDFEAFELLATEAGLLVGHRDGLNLRRANDGGDEQLLLSPGGVYGLVRSPSDPGLAYAVADAGSLHRLRKDATGWRMLPGWSLDGVSLNGIVEEAADSVWLGNSRGGPQRWSLDLKTGKVLERRVFGPAEGLMLDAESGTAIQSFDGRTFAVSGLRTFLLEKDRFVETRIEPFGLTADPSQLLTTEGEHGAVAASSDGAWYRAPGATKWEELRLPGGGAITDAAAEIHADGMIRLGTVDGLLQYDPKGYAPAPIAREVILRGLVRRQSEESSDRLALKPGQDIDLIGSGTLNFEVGMTSLLPNSRYRYRIEGLTSVWTDWAPAGTLTLPNPGPGEYTLVVEGEAGDGSAAKPLRFAFGVLPQWWQTGAAKAVYAAAGLMLLAGLVHTGTRVRARKIIAANRQLAAEVARRTRELEEANRELADSNEELRTSREAVIHSGKRADLIFKALNEALVGTVIDEHYRIDERIGAGGFGTVYRATQLHLDSVVAIKVFKPIPGHDAKRSMDRFRAEGLSAFRVNHPNAVRVLDFGISLDSVAYLVMEYLDGESLGDILAANGPLDARSVVAVLGPISDALAHAHEVDVIHRDVKPSNIVVCREGGEETFKLIDFGIAKVLDESTPTELKNLTATGLLMGTPNYMAPERFVERHYDGRSDVYSLGVIGYEMLAGSRPFADVGENYLPMVMQRLKESAPPLRDRAPQTPPELEELVMRMVANAVAERPTAREVAQALARMVERQDTSGHETPRPRDGAGTRSPATGNATQATPSSGQGLV